MPNFQHQHLRAPEGMASSVDLGATPEKWAIRIEGFLPGRNGTLRTSNALINALNTIGTNTVNGLAWYQNPYPVSQVDYDAGILRNDRLVVFRGGTEVWTHQVAFDLVERTISVGGGVHVGDIPDVVTGNTFYNLSMRTVNYQSEMYIVCGDGSQPYRYFMDSAEVEYLYQIGMNTPATPTSALNGAGVLTGAYTYKITYVDNLGRESSPSNASITLNPATQQIRVTFTWGSDAQVEAVRIYRNTAGVVSTWYLVTEITNTSTTTYDDNNTDATIQANDLCPDPGVNDPPQRASLLAIWGNRLIFNSRNIYDDTADIECVTRLQVSNLQVMSQFNADNWTDVGNSASDEITVISSYGSIFHIATREEIFQIFGTTPLGDATRENDFSDLMTSKFLVAEGCSAPDSWVQCPNSVMYLGNDGPKRLLINSGFQVEDAGNEIGDYFNRNIIQAVE